jgi:hypothetical protein
MRIPLLFFILSFIGIVRSQTTFSTHGSACLNCVYPNATVPSGCYRLTNIQTPSGLSACPGNPNNSPNNFCTYGQIWSSTCLNLQRPFTLNTTMYFGTEGTGYWGPGADGMCFVLKANPGAITTAQNGGLLGYTSSITPTANSMAVEFDTYTNGGSSVQNDPVDPITPSNDHISIFKSGSLAHGSTNELTPAVFAGQLEDGQPHNVIFHWDPFASLFSVTIDGNNIINLNVNLNTVLNSSTAYFGWTAASGWTGNVHWVCPNYTGVTTLPSETFSNCESGEVLLNAVEVGPTVNWTPSVGLSSSMGTTVTAYQPGSYTASYIDGCGLLKQKVFIVNNIPPTVTASSTIVCEGEVWTLSPASGNYTSLAWINNNNLQDTIWATNVSGTGNANYTLIPYHTSCPNPGEPIAVSANEFIISPLTAGNDVTECLAAGTSDYTLPLTDIQFPTDANIEWQTANGSIVNVAVNHALTVNNSGDYWITASYPNGCSLSDTIQITLTNNPEFGINGNNYLCVGTTNDLSIIGNFENIVWSNSSGTTLGIGNNLNITTGGTYIVEAMSAGCWGNDTLIVQSVSAITPYAGNNIQVCSNNPLNISGTTNSDYSIEWSTSNGTIIGPNSNALLTVGTSGNYIMTVTNAYGCQAQDDVNVVLNPIPTFSLGDDYSLCPQTPYSIALTNNVIYDQITWQDNSQASTFDGITGNSGIINVSATLGLGQCSYTDDLNITVYALPNWSLPNDFEVCFGQNINIPSSQVVEWPDGSIGTSYTVNNPPAGTSTIDAILHFGVGCEMNDAIEVIIHALPVVTLTSSGTITCAQPSIVCTGTTNADNFQTAWSSNVQPNIPTPSPNPLVLTVTTPGVYQVQCTDNTTQCTNAASVTVNVDTELPELTFTSPDTLSCWQTSIALDHFSVTNTNNYQASWSTADGQFLMGTEGTAVPFVVASGIYTVEITDNDNGCSQTFATPIPQTIDLGFDADDMVFPNIITQNKDNNNDIWRPFLKQNPDWDFYIYFKVYNMKVFNRWGAMVFESTPAQPYWNAEDVSTGDYFFTFEYTTQCGTIQSGKVCGNISVIQ